MFIAWFAVIGSVAASDTPAEAADKAGQLLEQAAIALEEADSARDRVRALTVTVQAYEAGLAAMRDGLRRAISHELDPPACEGGHYRTPGVEGGAT